MQNSNSYGVDGLRFSKELIHEKLLQQAVKRILKKIREDSVHKKETAESRDIEGKPFFKIDDFKIN